MSTTTPSSINYRLTGMINAFSSAASQIPSNTEFHAFVSGIVASLEATQKKYEGGEMEDDEVEAWLTAEMQPKMHAVMGEALRSVLEDPELMRLVGEL